MSCERIACSNTCSSDRRTLKKTSKPHHGELEATRDLERQPHRMDERVSMRVWLSPMNVLALIALLAVAVAVALGAPLIGIRDFDPG
ncbi:hypothetical protein PRIPAC_81227 [Pristionchus pacificus]|uniref:Uncharacterized protein n=1 Tax=Pristionchus pacificus TaxID=54126 RepID=A0A2A6BWR0_PRIPA|nr:hypothetical protein PRIPAC_81227 [Pristionchus pacificus]|eukprot:PDM70354.1 hypothetical protein PRIPAC_46600 [Pristionchus pacificus]